MKLYRFSEVTMVSGNLYGFWQSSKNSIFFKGAKHGRNWIQYRIV